MLFSDSYLTLKTASEGIFRDRGSKFIAYAFPVKNEAEIKASLQKVKNEHPSARHHCFAWRLGAGKQLFRSNDDGEPSGTAGRPILGQIQSADLSDVLIVVVRYFGGTLLGVNGLINAYRSAAADAIKNAEIEEKFIMFEYAIEFGFEDMNGVMKVLRDNDCRIVRQDYEAQNRIIFQLRKRNENSLLEQLKPLYKTKLTYLNTL